MASMKWDPHTGDHVWIKRDNCWREARITFIGPVFLQAMVEHTGEVIKQLTALDIRHEPEPASDSLT